MTNRFFRHIYDLPCVGIRTDTSSSLTWPKKSWAVYIRLGNGAGLVRGATAYITWRSGSAIWAKNNRGKRLPFLYPLQIGITRNGNKVPYLGH